MKKTLLISLLLITTISLKAQDDEYQRYLESMRQQMSEIQSDYNSNVSNINEEFADFKAKAIAEFADFMAKEWALFEEFKTQELSMNAPKPKQIPVAKETKITEVSSSELNYKENTDLPKVVQLADSDMNIKQTPEADAYVIRKLITDKGVEDIKDKKVIIPVAEEKATPSVNSTAIVKEPKINKDANLHIDFYGKKLSFKFDDKLRLKHRGIKETEVSNYVKELAKMSKETSDLWKQIDGYVKELGLNEWGYFCILRSLSEEVFTDIDNRVLFTFYMMRNEGGFKVKTARGKDSNRLTLLAAIDNSKEVYSYSFFRFDDANGKKLKYYTIYGGGKPKESVFTYAFCEHDNNLKQIGLDFNSTLNMGACDVKRELSFSKINTSVTLPYNSSHIAYLNDVPMTIFPIYFASPISIEAQEILNKKLNELKSKYNPVQFIDILLNFVQTAFDYKTDDQQFGYEKYFYPEEVIAYPYSDCEDRSALFAWLVTNYTDAKVVGLQYEGHLATAVCFGDNVNIGGDMFSYGGKKYYVCDPTYINASIGMTMPQFKGKMPKIIKMTK